MTPSLKELNDAIEDHTGWFFYHLSNAKRAKEVGSAISEARNITEAAERASILTALKAMRP